MNNSATASLSTVGWVKSPDGRGTLDLVVSCVFTFTLCVWSALHLNVPPANCTHRHLALEKTKWVLYGIFAPELVVATAASQYIVARWLKREIEKDAMARAPREKAEGLSTHTWSISQCYYAAMGGCVANVPWMGDNGKEEFRKLALTPAGIRLLSFAGRLPEIDEAHIRDKSKADWMAKTIVCVQAIWMVGQVVGRLIKQLPVSLLEINTCGHVICAMALYLLWWSKPLDIQDPSTVCRGDEDVLVLMLLCSKVGFINDGTSDVRCFYYDFANQNESQLQIALRNCCVSTGSTASKGRSNKPPVFRMATEVSLGSSGTEDLPEFHGFTGKAVKVPTENNGFRFEYDMTPMVAEECADYLSAPYSNLKLRHGDIYCRRARLKSRDLASYRRLDVHTLQRASRALDMIWAERQHRTEYTRLYFTTVPKMGSTGFHISETEYLVRHMTNLPSLTNLSLGQVDCHQNVLPAIFAFTALAYGGLHLSAWNDFYPSSAERYMWVGAALWIACSGALVWASCSLGLLTEKLGSVRILQKHGNLKESPWRRWLSRLARWCIYFVGATFAVTRVFLVVEAFASLREAPREMYLTPEWSDFLPHL